MTAVDPIVVEVGSAPITVTVASTGLVLSVATGTVGPAGAQGPAGTNGTNGQGVPTGGTTGQVLAKKSGTNYDTEWVDQSGGGGGGSGTVTSVTGTAPISVATGTTTPVVSIAAATTSAAGSMSAADKSKLDGVEAGATANATNAQLRDRSTHTGTQTLSTISDAGTAAAKNAPATGNAAATEVVLGSDTRLTDARTPSSTLSHASTHGAAGSDPVTVAQSQVTNLTTDLAGKVPTTRTVNGQALSADVSITTTTLGAVPTSRTVNSKALSSDVTLTASDIGAVPTTRTVAGKALSSDVTLTASDVGAVPTTRTVNGSALSSDITITAAPSGSAGGDLTGTYPNPTIASGAVTSAKVSGGLARQPIVAAAKIADTTSTSVYAGSSLVPVVGNTSATLALALGAVYMVRAQHDGATLNRLVLVVTATSLTAGQSVTVACFNDSAGTPTTRVWSQSVTIGTSTGAIITGSLSLTMPTGPCWIAILNPSGNAGTVTMRSHQTLGNFLTVANDASSAVVGLESQSSMPSDLTSNLLRTTTVSGSFAVGNLVPTFPKIIGNAS